MGRFPLAGTRPWRLNYGFSDPAAVEGLEEKRLAEFRRVRDELRAYLEGFPEP